MKPYRMLNGNRNFPACIEIQTINSCNAKCGVCPYTYTSSLKSRGRMSDELLAKILAECSQHSDEIELMVPYLNAEPFLDKRMIELLQRIRRDIGKPIEVSTNLSALDRDKMKIIVAESLIDVLRISIFGANQSSYEKRMAGLAWGRTVDHMDFLISLDPQINIELIMVGTADLLVDEVLELRNRWVHPKVSVKIFGYLDRAGKGATLNDLPLYHSTAKVVGCDLNRPFERMAICSDGTVVICSQDWTERHKLGNVNKNTISEIWNGRAFANTRDHVSGAAHAPADFICRSCKLAILE